MAEVMATSRMESLRDAGIMLLEQIGTESPPAFCEWQPDEEMDCLYETSCGMTWEFNDAGVEENRVKFCFGCGKPVKDIPPRSMSDVADL